MQSYCIKKNKAGFVAYSTLVAENRDAELASSFAACEGEWRLQWDMVEYCAKQQIDGKAEIPLKVQELPSDISATILEQCQSEWDNDFNMIAYCAGLNAAAWREINK